MLMDVPESLIFFEHPKNKNWIGWNAAVLLLQIEIFYGT